MPVFPLLHDPAHYRACPTDLLIDHAARRYWLDLFTSHVQVQLDAAASCGISREHCDAAGQAFRAELEHLRQQPDAFGRLDILLLDQRRQRHLSAHGVEDEFRRLKQRENELALNILPDWLRRLDEAPDPRRTEQLLRGMLAGNLFDMGVKATADAFGDNTVPFDETLRRVPPRPWLVDHTDDIDAALRHHPPRRPVIFADNAGADVVLGVLPLARTFLRARPDATVLITANDAPSLNDVTIDELRTLLDRAAHADPVFRSPRIETVPAGSRAPLIDLADIGHDLADAARDADLVVLVGMGRSVESNLHARFTTPAWKIAMIKDPQVARTVGGRLNDALVRAQPPATQEV